MMPQRPNNFTLNLNHPLAKGLVFAGLGAHAGSTRYHDSSVFGNTGTLTNMDPPTDWVWNTTLNQYALDFDGSDDIVFIPPSSAVASTKPPLPVTCSAWVNPANLTVVNPVFANDSNYPSTTYNRYGFTVQLAATSGVIAASYFNGGSVDAGASTRRTAVGSVGVPAGVWTHIAVVITGPTSFALYVNGNADPTVTTSGTGSAMAYGAYPGSVGAGTNTTGAITNKFTGRIGSPMLHARAISNSEIRLLADPSNVMLSGLIQPILNRPIPVPINDRHWVGRTSDWHSADNWSRSQGGRGGAGVPNENTNVFFD